MNSPILHRHFMGIFISGSIDAPELLTEVNICKIKLKKKKLNYFLLDFEYNLILFSKCLGIGQHYYTTILNIKTLLCN